MKNIKRKNNFLHESYFYAKKNVAVNLLAVVSHGFYLSKLHRTNLQSYRGKVITPSWEIDYRFLPVPQPFIKHAFYHISSVFLLTKNRLVKIKKNRALGSRFLFDALVLLSISSG